MIKIHKVTLKKFNIMKYNKINLVHHYYIKKMM